MPGRLTPSPRQANAIELPSGDQAGEVASRGAGKIVRPVPSAPITPSVLVPLLVNAIRVPSGDHAGSRSKAKGSRVCVLVTGSSAQSSGGGLKWRKSVNATRPSGIADGDP